MTTDACQTFESLLARAADDDLDADARATLDAHLATCAACRAALADQRIVRAALIARPPLFAQPDFAIRVARSIEADAQAAHSWLDLLDFRQWTWRLVPVAAALSLAAWFTVSSTATSGSSAASVTAFDEDAPVAAALWDESVSDTSVLSLMLRAGANDPLSTAYKER